MFSSIPRRTREIPGRSFTSSPFQLMRVGTAKCRSFESEKDLFAFLLLFPSLRVERTSPVYLSDQDAADLGFADC